MGKLFAKVASLLEEAQHLGLQKAGRRVCQLSSPLKRVSPQIGTCDTAVGVDQPEVTRGKTQLQIQEEFSVSCHTSPIIFSAHSWEVWGNKLSALSFLEQMPGAGPSDVCF